MFIEIFAFFNGSAWQNMFSLDETVFWTEKILRPVIVYVALIILLRFFGKRELGQLNPLDLVVILSLSNTVQNAIIGEDNSLVGGVVGAFTLLGINFLFGLLKYKSKLAEDVIEGKPVILVENGKINEKAVKREMLTEEDLDVIAHKEGFGGIDEIEKCILDPNGSVLVEGKDINNDEKFRREVLRRLEELTRELKHLKQGA